MRKRNRSWRICQTIGILATALVGCSDDPAGPADSPIPHTLIPHTLEVISGQHQEGLADQVLATPIALQVLDQDRNPLEGIAIRVVPLEEGAGSVSDTLLTSDSDGMASVEWTLGHRPGINHLTAMAGQSSGLQAGVQATLPFVVDLPDSLLTWPSDTLSLGGFVTDEAGTALDVGHFVWDFEGLASVASDTMVLPVQEGIANVVVSLPDVSDPTRTQWRKDLHLTVAGEIRLDVHGLNGQEPNEDLLLVLETEGGHADSAVYLPNSGFHLRATRPLQGTVGVLTIDSRTPETREFLPTVRDQLALPAVGLSAILFPLEWNIERGRWAGTSVSISLFDAWGADVSPHPIHRSYLNRNNLSSWREHDFPIPLYFKRYDELPDGYESQWEITASDSTVIWWYVENMNERFGRELFKPARIEDLSLDSMYFKHPPGQERWFHYVPKSVTFSTLKRPNTGNPHGGSSTCTIFNVDHIDENVCDKYAINRFEISRGGVTFPLKQTLGAIQHELLHAMGFGHTQFWCSTMLYRELPSSSENRCERTRDNPGPGWIDVTPWGTETGGALPGDIAYFELWLATNEWHHQHGGVTLGIVESYRGERTILLDNYDASDRPYQRRRDGWFGPF